MILKSLTLQGFKSFPERTVIRFHEGVTAIVGPNGSGKSNITDAIRWVLGEQSVKVLRAGKMEELIFSGTQSRRPLSYAEITLTMDNTDRTLPMDFPEIRVSRRIYRSGESEYLLNDSRCRLKDINELFLDTGIGRDGYSMIGQGRVDDILSGKAELRRKMLDEASGITKYKLRKDEAEKKLAHTEQNLLRLDDIINEIEKQKAPLERQAKKAKTFLTLHEELKQEDLALLYYEIEQKERDLLKFREEANRLSQTLQEVETRKAKVMEQSAAQREAMQEATDKLQTLQTEEQDTQRELGRHEQELALATQKLEQIENRKTRFQTQGDELLKRLELLQQEEAEITKENEKLVLQENEENSLFLSFEENFSNLLHTRQESVSMREDLEAKESQIRQLIQNIQQHVRDDQTNLEVLKSHRSMLEKDLTSVDSELELENKEADKLYSRLEEVRHLQKEQINRSAALESEREQKRLALAKVGGQLNQYQQQLQNLSYKQKTQTELAESYEGYAFPVKRLMEWAKGKTTGVHGPLANLLQVPQEYEAAVESILGGTSQHVVVDSEDLASEMIQRLKEENWGRATFLPLNRVQSREIAGNDLRTLERLSGYLGLASDLVDFKPNIRPAVLYALGRTVVAETLEQALTMAKATSFRVRIASLDGDLLNPGGSMSGGSKKQQSSGILGRQRQLESISEEILQTKEEIENHQSALEEMTEAVERAENALAEIGETVGQLSREEILLESHRKQYEQNKIRLQSKLDQNQADLERLETETAELAKALAKSSKEEENYTDELASILNERKKVADLLETSQVQLNELSEARSAQQVKVAQIREKTSSAAQLIQRIQQERLQVEEELAAQSSDQTEDLAEQERLQTLLANGDEAKAKILAQREAILKQVKEAEQLRLDAVRTMDENTGEMDTVSGLLSKLGQEQGRLEQRTENSESNLMDLRSRLWEDYNLTFQNRDAHYREDLDLSATRSFVKELRQKIKELGSVNIQAIEESRELNERFAFMGKQREDIVSAGDDLKKIIRELTEEMQEQFKTSFSFINENFRSVFRELFGGGEAELILEDSQDILNSPIDIKVMPPGKRLQNMLALSGGERCLTAIALLFAIQKLNPSPFCVLDEVEAALDESNVFRFTDYVKANSANTQYILVTHRRGTMEAATMIYGITMQERGVSQVISVRLAESE